MVMIQVFHTCAGGSIPPETVDERYPTEFNDFFLLFFSDKTERSIIADPSDDDCLCFRLESDQKFDLIFTQKIYIVRCVNRSFGIYSVDVFVHISLQIDSKKYFFLLLLMSSSRSYSKESRSFYSRSSSSNNANRDEQRFSRDFDHRRPLSSRLIDREYSSTSLDRSVDHPSYFDRRRKEILDEFERRRRKFFHSSFDDLVNDDFFKSDFGRDSSNFFGTGRTIPVQYQGRDYHSLTTRTIPVQYVPSSTNREKFDRSFDSNSKGQWRFFFMW